MAMIIITVGEKKVDQLGLECSQRCIGGWGGGELLLRRERNRKLLEAVELQQAVGGSSPRARL